MITNANRSGTPFYLGNSRDGDSAVMDKPGKASLRHERDKRVR